jgi:D-alanyl-D-alanine carboxypeptidase
MISFLVDFSLFLGMMLPSGNDAAQTISENLGRLLMSAPVLVRQESSALSDTINISKSKRALTKQGTIESLANFTGVSQKTKQQKKSPLNKPFLERMNKLAESLGMANSTYYNPHGLMNKFNVSSAYDLSLLLADAFTNMPRFVEIISTEAYSGQIERYGESETLDWSNTHKGIDDPRFIGGKTGITVAAGPCLATVKMLNEASRVAIVVLNCKIL